MNELHPVFQKVEQFLLGQLTTDELQDWLAARLGLIIEASDTPAGRLAARAQHIGILLESGDVEEAELYEALRETYSETLGEHVANAAGVWTLGGAELPVPVEGGSNAETIDAGAFESGIFMMPAVDEPEGSSLAHTSHEGVFA